VGVEHWRNYIDTRKAKYSERMVMTVENEVHTKPLPFSLYAPQIPQRPARKGMRMEYHGRSSPQLIKESYTSPVTSGSRKGV
jgi:hypothetical protein